MSGNYYEHYWEKTGWRADDMPFRNEEIELIEKHFDKQGAIIDYGCGSGLRYGVALKQRGNAYVGADISLAALKQAASHGIRTSPINSDDGTVALDDQSFDYAMCMEVLEHLMHPAQAIREIHRLLKPGGRLIVSVPNAGFYINRIEFLLTGFLNPGGSPETSRKTPWEDCHIRFYNLRTIKKLLSSNEFRLDEIRGERFQLKDLPVFYRKPNLHSLFNAVSFPLWWLGRVFPGLFSGTLYLVFTKSSIAPETE